MVEQAIELSDETNSVADRDVREMSTTVGAALAETVRTTLGPRGMDKLLVDSDGMVIVTSDCYTLLGQMDIDLDLIPGGKLLVELAKSQDDSVGDGTTTAIVFAGELLHRAEDLVDKGIHPTVITRGYQIAAEKSQSILESYSTPIKASDTETVQHVAQTAMAGTVSEEGEQRLAELIVKAIQAGEGDDILPPENVSIEKVVGGRVRDSTLVHGLLLDKDPVDVNMPRRIESPRIACLNTDIDVAKTTTELSEIVVRDTDDHREVLDYETDTVRSMAHAIGESGADAVFSNKSIDKKAQQFFAEQGILAVRRMSTSDLQHLAQTTGAMTAADVTVLESADLGTATIVEQRDVGGERKLVIETGGRSDRASLVLRGGTEHAIDEIERAVRNGLGATSTVVRDGRTIPGGGAPEMEVALELRNYADSISGREQFAVRAFADAIEAVPRTLSENAGLDPIDAVIELRRRHAGGECNTGVDGITGSFVDTRKAGILEPLWVKTQSISSAVEVTNRILTIDDILTAQSTDEDH